MRMIKKKYSTRMSKEDTEELIKYHTCTNCMLAFQTLIPRLGTRLLRTHSLIIIYSVYLYILSAKRFSVKNENKADFLSATKLCTYQ